MTKQDYYNRRLALEREFYHCLHIGDHDKAKETKKQIGEFLIQGLQELGVQDFVDIELKFEIDNY